MIDRVVKRFLAAKHRGYVVYTTTLTIYRMEDESTEKEKDTFQPGWLLNAIASMETAHRRGGGRAKVKLSDNAVVAKSDWQDEGFDDSLIEYELTTVLQRQDSKRFTEPELKIIKDFLRKW